MKISGNGSHPRHSTENGGEGPYLGDDSFNLTDAGNGQRFASQHGADVRYCYAWRKWIIWDGRRWQIDAKGNIEKRAKQTARSIYLDAADASNHEEARRLGKWAGVSESHSRLYAMLAAAKSESPLPILPEAFDNAPYLLNCENGTVDLRTGELRPHRREDFLMKLCPVAYPADPSIKPARFLKFLDRIFAGDPHLIRFMQRLLGLSLVGQVIEQKLPIFHGSGANGKSTLIEVWCDILGPDFAMKASSNFLVVDKFGRHPTELTDLHGKRFVAAVETEDGARLAESHVKGLTGGDTIRARRMREDMWEFKPSHTLVLVTNHRPEVRGTDHATWRRIVLVPFTVAIPESEQDKNLIAKLRGEGPAILAWAVQGCLDWQQQGLEPPAVVARATEDYRSESDALGEFLAERCDISPGAKVQAGRLYADYKAWVGRRSETAESQTSFGRRIIERGHARRKSHGVMIYAGLSLKLDNAEVGGF